LALQSVSYQANYNLHTSKNETDCYRKDESYQLGLNQRVNRDKAIFLGF